METAVKQAAKHGRNGDVEEGELPPSSLEEP